MDSNLTLLGELESVGLEPEKNLLDSLLISADDGAKQVVVVAFFDFGLFGPVVDLLCNLILVKVFDVFKSGVKLYVLLLSFFSLHTHDALNGVSDVESVNVLSELSSFNLRVVKQVLHHECHHFG